MTITYRALMVDHDNIEHLARLLEDDTNFLKIEDPAASRRHLVELARVIADHIRVEKQVIEVVEQKCLTAVWGGRWPEVVNDVAKLDRDTQRLLSEWDEPAINSDLSGFASAIKTFSRTCRSATHREVDSFYAKALQSGALTLR